MKILRFYGENVKRLKAVEIKPDGNLVQITGKNGHGKSSILDSIAWALDFAAHGQSVPIRKGATTAKIVLDIGDNGASQLVVERRFTEKASYLEVRNSEGFKAGSPQKILDDLVGAISMDPVAFLRQRAADQVETLRRLVGVDFSALDVERKHLFAERTLVNRDGKNKAGELAGIQFAAEQPYETVDVSALLEEQRQAETENRRRDSADRSLTEAQREVTKHTNRIAALREELASAQSDLDFWNGRVGELELQCDVTRIDVEPIRTRIAAANETNAKAAAWRSKKELHDRLSAEVDGLRTKSASLTQAIDQIDTDKAKTIAAADMPVTGLGFGDGCVTFDGLPLEQASDAQQLEISMAIAAAMNPKLRVLRIRDGSLLDDDALARVAAWAEEKDMQVWMEIVQSDSPTAVWIEDGAVAGQPELVAAE